jgi:hypothetical protein
MANDTQWVNDHIEVTADTWNGTVKVKFIRANVKRVTTTRTTGHMPVSAPIITNCAPTSAVTEPVTVIRSDNTTNNQGFTFVILQGCHYEIKPEFLNQSCPPGAGNLQTFSKFDHEDLGSAQGSITHVRRFDFGNGDEVHITVVLSETIGGGGSTPDNAKATSLTQLDDRVATLEKSIKSIQSKLAKILKTNGGNTIKVKTKPTRITNGNGRVKSATKAAGAKKARKAAKAKSR